MSGRVCLLSWSSFLRVAWTLLAVAAVRSGAKAQDITFGGNARAYAMAGAGLAIVDKTAHTTLVNPAAIALYDRKTHLEFPTLGLHASGIPLGQAWDHLVSHPDENNATDLARDFGSRESDFGASVGLGIRIGHLELRGFGVATAHVIPNQALETWAQTANGDVSKLTGAERADLLAAAVYALPQIGYAERISPPGDPTRIEAGVRVKLERAVYSHYIVDSANIANNTAAEPAPELNGGTTLTKDGIGGDLGLLVHPAQHDGFSEALVVTNLANPNFVFHGTDTMGNPMKYDIQPRSVSVGTAYAGGRFTAAFDVVDLTRAYENVEARVGAEWESHHLALRAGYSSATGFAAGFGWGWFQFAFGNRAPLIITETLRF